MAFLYVLWHVPLLAFLCYLAVLFWRSRFRGRGLPLQGKWLRLFVLAWGLLGFWFLLALIWNGARALGL